MNEKQSSTTSLDKVQTQVTYFLWNRNLIGWLNVAKRMVWVLTATQIVDGTQTGALLFVALREGLSAVTDYAQAKNPASTVQKSSPPNPPTETDSSTQTNTDHAEQTTLPA